MSDVFTHPWLSGLFQDPEVHAIWSPERQIKDMRAFEAAWSRALGRAGLFDAAEAEAAANAIEAMEFDLDALRAGIAKDGVVIPALVSQMKAAAGGAKTAVHSGATSQDVIDTSLALMMRDTLDVLDSRLASLDTALRAQCDTFGALPLMGRTRMQAATEITVADRMMPWIMPLADHRSRIQQARPRIAKVQIGGASGDRAAIRGHEAQITQDVATALGLENPPRAWHAMRDGVAEFAAILTLISGTLGKMGQDMALMAQQGLGEIALAGGGASSAMAHKQNPVLAELLVTLARFNATSDAGIQHAMIHEQERSGAAWALEWMILPQMAETTARALSVAQSLSQNILRIGTPAI